MIKIGEEKFTAPPHFSQNSIFGKKGGKNTQNQPKIQPCQNELKYSG